MQNMHRERSEIVPTPFIHLERQHIFPVLLFIYVVINLISIHLNIWNTKPVESYIACIASFIPSINKTVAIAKEPGSAAFVLATSWSFVPIGYFMFLCMARWRKFEISRHDKVNTITMTILSMLFLPLIIMFFFYFVPNPSSIGHFDRFGFVITGITKSRYFIILYGSALWLAGSSVLFFVTWQLYQFYTRIIKRTEATK